MSMTQSEKIATEILQNFTRHGRRYYLFSVQGDPASYLYFCRIEGVPLRSLIYGNGFLPAIIELVQDEKTCIECGLGTRIQGGVSLDGDMLVEYNMTIDQANLFLLGLRKLMPEDESFFIPFARTMNRSR